MPRANRFDAALAAAQRSRDLAQWDAVQAPSGETPRTRGGTNAAIEQADPRAVLCVCRRSAMLRVESPDGPTICMSEVPRLHSSPPPRAQPTHGCRRLACLETRTALVDAVARGVASLPQRQLESAFPEADMPIPLEPPSSTSVDEWLASAANASESAQDVPVECHGAHVHTSAVDEATLTGKAVLVRRHGRCYIRARSTTGRAVDCLVKHSGDLRRDWLWQQVLHRLCRILASVASYRVVPTYGVIPARDPGTGGVVVLLPNAVTLYSLLPPATGNSETGSGTFASLQATAPRLLLQRHVCRGVDGCWEWFAATRALVSSVAIGAVLGAAMGLGDRHLANIVVDADYRVAHVDLQVLGGDGALLPVPECVPLRFTAIVSDVAGCRQEAFAPEFAAALTAWSRLKKPVVAALNALISPCAASFSRRREVYDFDGMSSDVGAFVDRISQATDPARLERMHSSWMPWI
uniref:PI3K/PI4K catalytic domain-containing protein n=1 Tax=Neobodo designis TaxID=312471 RepID=A0A7S1QPB0_NEODS|mmetsp:Transcript_49707/g.153597  ORF Transcript_49707/g.153597 Transcript_49707/m.153597 type:complete len:466 (+) Transcript_49707:61-1458(+)